MNHKGGTMASRRQLKLGSAATGTTIAPMLWCAAILISLSPSPSQAASSLETCRMVRLATERLACYDRLYPPFEQNSVNRDGDRAALEPPKVSALPPASPPTVVQPSAAPERQSSPMPQRTPAPTQARPLEPAEQPEPQRATVAESPRPLPEPASTLAAETKDTEENFGYAQKRKTKSTKLKQITATVQNVDRKWPDNRYVYNLDNGQTWEQTKAQRTTIREGDSVTIKRGRLGGYLMANERGASSRVARVGDG